MRLDRDQRIDHRVPYEVHALVSNAFPPQVLDCLLGMDEQVVRELVGDDAVYLLGHGAIEAPQARLDVRDWDAELDRHERGGKRRVHVPGHDHQVRSLGDQQRFEPLHDTRRLYGMAGGANVQVVVRLGEIQLLEQHVRHHPVVVLPGVDHDVAVLGQAAAKLRDHRGHLYYVRACPDDVHYEHVKGRLSGW